MAECAPLLAEMPAAAAATAVVELLTSVAHHLYHPAHARSKIYLHVLLIVQAFRPRKSVKSCVAQPPDRRAYNEGQPGRCGEGTCVAENRDSFITEQPHLLSVMSARPGNGGTVKKKRKTLWLWLALPLVGQ